MNSGMTIKTEVGRCRADLKQYKLEKRERGHLDCRKVKVMRLT